jgi:tetratricopeptide (TPR) repeat protein
MSAKESMVTAPLAALILDRALAQKTCLEVIRRRWAFYAGLCVSWSVLAALLWHGPRGDSAGLEHVGVWDYLLNQCWVLADYGYKVFWPYPLALDYGYARPLSLLVVAPEALVLLVVGALTLWGLWRNRLAGTAMALVFLTLAPTSSLLPIATEVGAERRMYLALAALLPLLVTGLLFLLQRVLGAVQVRWVGMALASIAVLVFAGITARRNLDYRSEKTLWQSAVQAVPDNARAHNNLALALQAEGNLEQAVLSYRRALESDPNLSQAYNNLGGSLYRLRRLPEAIAVLRQALVGRPHFLEARYNLGQALLAAGQYEQAVVHLRKVLVVEPDMFAARFKAGEALLGLGRVDEALANFVRAAQLRPGDVETRLYLGRAYEQLGRASAAAGTYRRVLELQPSNAVALERITAIGAAVE